MHIFGGVMFSMGISQFGYQVWTWLMNGSWPSFTNFNMLAEFVGYRPYFEAWLTQAVADRLLDCEMSLTLLAIGLSILFFRPVAEVIIERRAAALLAMNKKQLAITQGMRLPTWTRMDFRHTS